MNDIKIEGKFIGLPEIMKKMNFVEEIGMFTRKFTRIYVDGNSLFIGHTISDKKTKIEFSDMKDWIKYFDRI